MTQQSAKQFIEKCQKDPNFKKRISQAKNQNDVKTILKENGLSFTKEEYKAAAKEVLGKECTEQDLMKITGGNAPAYFGE